MSQNGLNGHDQKHRILVAPVSAVGHMNACIGVTKPLLKRGHRVAFFIEKPFEGKLKDLGFEEFVYELTPDPEKNDHMDKNKNPGDRLAHMLLKMGILGQKDEYEQMKIMTEKWSQNKSEQRKINQTHKHLKRVIESFQPELFIIDHVMLDAAIYYSNIPWVKIISTVPLLYLHDIDELPPSWSGLSTNSDRSEWSKFRKLQLKFVYSNEYNDRVQEQGYERFPQNEMMPSTQILTIYAFPEEYNYPQIKTYHPDWYNIEVFNKNECQETIDLKELLPEEFYHDDLGGRWSGKWVYVSMGSMGSADLDLMHRLIEALQNTPHKYIVSKGPRHSEYELKGNLWGDRYLPQVKLLPLMDLVITHGGNNTITETFAQGKPMIIFPLFADQHDNAVRLSEKNFAKKLGPYTFEENELIEAVDQLLYDEDLKQKLTEASKRIRNTDHHQIVCNKIEEILDKVCYDGKIDNNNNSMQEFKTNGHS